MHWSKSTESLLGTHAGLIGLDSVCVQPVTLEFELDSVGGYTQYRTVSEGHYRLFLSVCISDSCS